jgi:hypothetical protein
MAVSRRASGGAATEVARSVDNGLPMGDLPPFAEVLTGEGTHRRTALAFHREWVNRRFLNTVEKIDSLFEPALLSQPGAAAPGAGRDICPDSRGRCSDGPCKSRLPTRNHFLVVHPDR